MHGPQQDDEASVVPINKRKSNFKLGDNYSCFPYRQNRVVCGAHKRSPDSSCISLTVLWSVLDKGEKYKLAFLVTNGVKQGCVLTPTLFSMFFSAMMKDVF